MCSWSVSQPGRGAPDAGGLRASARRRLVGGGLDAEFFLTARSAAPAGLDMNTARPSDRRSGVDVSCALGNPVGIECQAAAIAAAELQALAEEARSATLKEW